MKSRRSHEMEWITLEEMRKGGLAPHVADYLHVLRLDDCPQAYGISGSDKLEYLSNRDAY